MSQTVLNLRLDPRRLLDKRAAASYCGFTPQIFQRLCPVKPIALADNVERYDMRDLDRWIDGLKGETVEQSADDILRKLG